MVMIKNEEVAMVWAEGEEELLISSIRLNKWMDFKQVIYHQIKMWLMKTMINGELVREEHWKRLFVEGEGEEIIINKL